MVIRNRGDGVWDYRRTPSTLSDEKDWRGGQDRQRRCVKIQTVNRNTRKGKERKGGNEVGGQLPNTKRSSHKSLTATNYLRLPYHRMRGDRSPPHSIMEKRRRDGGREGRGIKVELSRRRKKGAMRRTFLDNPLHAGQSEPSGEDGRYVRDVHCICVYISWCCWYVVIDIRKRMNANVSNIPTYLPPPAI